MSQPIVVDGKLEGTKVVRLQADQKVEAKIEKQKLTLKDTTILFHTERAEYDRNKRMIHYIDAKFPHKRTNFAVFGNEVNKRMTESPLNFDAIVCGKHVVDCFEKFDDKTQNNIAYLKAIRYQQLRLERLSESGKARDASAQEM